MGREIAFAVTAEKLPRGQAPLADQFRRAAHVDSPEQRRGQRSRFWFGLECGAILDVVRLLDVARDAESAQAKSLLTRIVEMLSKMS